MTTTDVAPTTVATSGAPRFRWLVVIAAAAGVAISATYPPIGFWWIAPVAYAPLLWVWRRSGPGHAAVLGLVAGTVSAGIVCSWMWYFGAVAFAPFALAMGAFPALIGYVTALIRPARGPWIEATVWVAGEALLGRFPFGGMPWMAAGTQLAPFDPVRALAPWGGVLLVTFVLIACNGLVVDGVEGLRSGPSRTRLIRAGLGLVGIVVLVTAAVAVWPRTEPAGELRYALLQGNNLNRRLTDQETADNYLRESHFGLAATLEGPYDLIVFPESALDGDDPETSAALSRRVEALARRHDSWVMLNTNEDVGPVTYNTNRIYDSKGQLVASYRKQQLVPFGEYLPFGWVRTIAPQIEQIGDGYAPGSGSITVPVAGHPLTTIICFENAFSRLVREAAADGAQGIVLSTNNRSYRRSGNSAQHLQLTQWRAAELGRPVLHAAISGISATVDDRGRVEQQTRLFERTTLSGVTELRRGSTPYARLGDWPALLAACVTLALVLVTLRPRRTRAAGKGA